MRLRKMVNDFGMIVPPGRDYTLLFSDVSRCAFVEWEQSL
jgi:hypothetical protein